MKPNLPYRSAMAVAALAIAMLFLLSKRNQPKRISSKETKINGGKSNMQVSNTDYIFFESLSKYMFISAN